MKQFKIQFVASGRGEARCKPNPLYPDGKHITTEGDRKCITGLPYPAVECGVFTIQCNFCGLKVAVTAAGRPDDPKSIEIPCKGLTH